MNLNNLNKWICQTISINKRLRNVCICYIIFLMMEMRKHSLEEAARFSKLTKSRFSKFLKNHSKLAVYTLNDLSKKQAKQFSKTMKCLGNNNLPWKIGILVDSTIQGRSSERTENAKKFNHGQGFVIGHQWTNIVLIINDMIIPLPPIPYHTKSYCRRYNLEYKTEHELVIEYLDRLNLEDYIGPHDPKEVVVITDSGYDDKDIENTIVNKKWNFIIPLKKERSVKSEKEYISTPKSKNWSQVATFFKNHRRLKWETICIPTNSAKKKRIDFRTRQTIGYLRHVGKVQLVCSEPKKRPDGRRKYFACNDLEATAQQIVMGYRIRWSIEIFHKEVKSYLGFEDVATKWFASVEAHVHWVYCAYILLNFNPPGIPEHVNTIMEKQRIIKKMVDNKEKSRVLQQLTRFGGVERYKNELRRALASAMIPSNP